MIPISGPAGPLAALPKIVSECLQFVIDHYSTRAPQDQEKVHETRELKSGGPNPLRVGNPSLHWNTGSGSVYVVAVQISYRPSHGVHSITSLLILYGNLRLGMQFADDGYDFGYRLHSVPCHFGSLPQIGLPAQTSRPTSDSCESLHSWADLRCFKETATVQSCSVNSNELPRFLTVDVISILRRVLYLRHLV